MDLLEAHSKDENISADQHEQHAQIGSEAPAYPRSIWRNRDYLLMWSGQIVSAVGSRVSQLAFPLLMFAVTHSPAQAGFLSAARGVAYAVCMLPAGALVDRWNRKRVMILSDAGRALALGSIPVSVALGHLTIVQLYVVSLVEGGLFVFFGLAEAAAIPQVVGKEQIGDATAQVQIVESASSLIGPSLGGALFGLGQLFPFLADAISYVFSVVSLCFIRREFQEERTANETRMTLRQLYTEVREGLVWLWREPLLRFIALLTGGLIFPVAGYALILIVLAQGQHATNAEIGLIFAGGGAGTLAGALLSGPVQRRFSFGRIMIVGTWCWALTWLLFAVARTPLTLGIVTGVTFVVVPVYMAAQFSYRLRLIPDHLQGRVNSVFRLIAFGSEPLGLALTGVLLQIWGPVPTILILFVPQLVLAIAATYSRSLRAARA
ncbi:MAG: MFS transporter [Ktedonobacterales bacterium]